MSYLVAFCLGTDVAAAIIQHPDAQRMPLNDEAKNLRPIYALAHMPSAFRSAETRLHWCQLLIYNGTSNLSHTWLINYYT